MTFSVFERIVLTGLTIGTFIRFFFEIWRRLIIVRKGSGTFSLDRLPERLIRVVKEVIFHMRVIGGRIWPGIMHAFVFWGFIVFALVTLDHFALGFGFPFLKGNIYHVYSWIAILFAICVIFGIVALTFRRFILRPESLGKPSPSSGFVAFLIFLLMVTYIYGETNPPPFLDRVNWWLHSLAILVFLILIPRSKHLHLVLAPFNIFFRSFDTPDHSTIKIDLEASEEELDNLLKELNCLSKNQALDIFSCVECGRCTEVCPANRGGGTLSPKEHFMVDLREPLLTSGDVAVLNLIKPDAGWECTTCQACTFVCPVGNQVEKADEIRRIQVLIEGNVPQEFQKVFLNLQETGNTEGASQSPLARRLPIYSSEKEYLLWLGCFARYELDPDFTTSVENYIRILDNAGVSYGILEEEWCCGDPANRLGEKMTFQLLMEHNLEQLSDVKKITTLCPHCVVNLQIEYRKYAVLPYQVRHHTQVINSLLLQNRIKIRPETDGFYTFHDPCQLARIVGDVNSSRRSIQRVTQNFSELPERKEKTLCCGGGGGLWWRKEGTGRTHLVRALQIVDSQCDTLITSCNYCYGMFNQGLGPLTPENRQPVNVKDIADLVADNLG